LSSRWGVGMSHKRYLLSTTAVLTGLTVLVGGVREADAATTTTPQTDTFYIEAANDFPGTTNLSFQQFNPALGILTSVDFSVDSYLQNYGPQSATASISVDSVQLSSQSSSSSGIYDTAFSGLSGAANAAYYTGTSTFNAYLSLADFSSNALWTGDGDYTGLTLTYDYTPTTTTPLPAALPLFATGVAGVGLTAWRRRRKQKAVEHA